MQTRTHSGVKFPAKPPSSGRVLGPHTTSHSRAHPLWPARARQPARAYYEALCKMPAVKVGTSPCRAPAGDEDAGAAALRSETSPDPPSPPALVVAGGEELLLLLPVPGARERRGWAPSGALGVREAPSAAGWRGHAGPCRGRRLAAWHCHCDVGGAWDGVPGCGPGLFPLAGAHAGRGGGDQAWVRQADRPARTAQPRLAQAGLERPSLCRLICASGCAWDGAIHCDCSQPGRGPCPVFWGGVRIRPPPPHALAQRRLL